MNPVTVLLADDHTIVREGFRALLELAKDITVVAEARNGREAIELALQLKPAVIVMDIAMPVLNGISATQQILAALPATRVLILSAYSDDPYIHRVLEVGAAGFLVKQSSAQCLSQAIREVNAGKLFFSPSVARRIQLWSRDVSRLGAVKAAKALTGRELEVIQRIAEGSTNKEIGSGLGISVKTVEKHRQHLMDKLDIHDTAGLTRYAIGHGIIESIVHVTII